MILTSDLNPYPGPILLCGKILVDSKFTSSALLVMAFEYNIAYAFLINPKKTVRMNLYHN